MPGNKTIRNGSINILSISKRRDYAREHFADSDDMHLIEAFEISRSSEDKFEMMIKAYDLGFAQGYFAGRGRKIKGYRKRKHAAAKS